MDEAPKSRQTATLVFAAVLIALAVGVGVMRVMSHAKMVASKECRARLSTIGALVQAWKGTHGGQLPDFAGLRSLTPSAGRPSSWVCPADRSNPMRNQENPALFRAEDASYVLLPDKGNARDNSAVFLRCRIHGHECLTDGSVREGTDAAE